MGEATVPSHVPPSTHLTFETVTGFFLQDDPDTDPATFDYRTTNFGLIKQIYDTDQSLPARDNASSWTQWQRFSHKIENMNSAAPAETRYKLLFLGRHGEGYHNVAEKFYGRTAWDCYFSALDGNGSITWSDAHLTPTGKDQAQSNRDFWEEQMQDQKVPAPDSYYVSPLDRCLETAQLTFSRLDLPASKPFKPTVKELLREANGIHTCDRRSSRSYISSTYPSCTIEPGFAEVDPLWLPDLRESDSALTLRLKTLFDDIFTTDGRSTFTSLTSHSGAIAGALRAVGHREFRLKTGAIIPILVKAVRVQGERPKEKIDPWTPMPKCDGDTEKAIAENLARN